MADPEIYPDLQVREGQSFASRTRSGFSCKRSFFVDHADNGDPQGTLINVLASGVLNAGPLDLPARMAPHPSLVVETPWSTYMSANGVFEENTAFCADIISASGVTSTQVKVDVEYAILNAVTQEPSEIGDAAPALIQVGASVQAAKVAVDNRGNPLIVPYLKAGPTAGDYKISPSGNVEGPFTPNPSIKITSEKQFPATLFRFMRRERKPRSPEGLVGLIHVNDDPGAPWTLDLNSSFVPKDQTMFLARIENQSDDGNLSYVVTYEFAYAPLIDYAADANFSGEAVDIDGQISPWQLNAYYVLPSGIGVDSSNVLAFQHNEVPPDGIPTVFQMYDTVDLNVLLSLSPAP